MKMKKLGLFVLNLSSFKCTVQSVLNKPLVKHNK